MKMYKQKFNRGKGSVSNIPNAIAYTFIRSYMNSKEFEEIAHSMFIKKMNKQQVSDAMTEVKWLFRNYPGLEVMTLQDEKGNVTRFEL